MTLEISRIVSGIKLKKIGYNNFRLCHLGGKMRIYTPASRQRHISDDFILELKSGVLKGLLSEILKADSELLLCFRGGKKEYVNVYYMGHSLYKITKGRGRYLLTFDFKHARYTSDWATISESLKGLGYTINKSRQLRFVVAKQSPTEDFWRTSISTLKGLIADFFNTEKRYDFFKNAEKANKSGLLEKQRQQSIMGANQDPNGEYFIYDMEYDQARTSSKDAKSGRFDMLAIRRAASGQHFLSFIELKSTRGACTGKSDISKHLRDLQTYLTNKAFIDVRKSEAANIYGHYLQLTGIKSIRNIEFAGVEILFIFTDDAIRYFSRGDLRNNQKIILRPPYILSYPQT